MASRKFNADTVIEVLQKRLRDEKVVQQILADIQNLDAKVAAEQEAEKPEPVQRGFAIVLPPQGDGTGWVVQIPEAMPPAVIEAKLREAAESYNSSPAGRKHPVETLGATFETVSGKHLKPFEIRVKTRLPVAAVTLSSNDLAAGTGGAGPGRRSLSKGDLKRLRERE